jgi:chromosome segregation ATPase
MNEKGVTDAFGALGDIIGNMRNRLEWFEKGESRENDLRGEIAMIENARDTLKRDYNGLKSEYNKLEDKLGDLEKENNCLKNEINWLNNEIKRRMHTCQDTFP